MRTQGEFVSRVINDLKGLTKDGRVNRRHVLKIGQDKARFLMNQKLDELSLFREEGIVTTLNCFEFEKDSVVKCGIAEFKTCNSLMKSIEKLPEGLSGKNGASIILVSTIDGSEIFKRTNRRRYAELKSLKYRKNLNNYYLVEDGRMLLPDSTYEALDVQMITTDKKHAETVSSCCENKNPCKSLWEYEFVCPDRFYDLVVTDTLSELANIYRTSVEDSNPNLDINQKGKTTE